VTTPIIEQCGRSNLIQLSATTGLSLYGVLIQPGTALPSAETWPGTAILSLTESTPGLRQYFATVPAGLTGLYLCPIYIQSGSQPASTDLQLGECTEVDDSTEGSPVTLVIDLDSLSTIKSIRRLGAAPGRPRIEPIPQPQSSAATAQRILSALYTAREEIAVSGMASVSIDGQTFAYSSVSQLDNSILFWERKVARLTGRRRRLMPVRLDRF